MKDRETIWENYNSVLAAVAEGRVDSEIVMIAKYTLDDLRRIQYIGIEAYMLPNWLIRLFGALNSLAAIFAAVIVITAVTLYVSLNLGFEATAATLEKNKIAAVVVMQLSMIMMTVLTAVTRPLIGVALRAWLSGKIRRLKRATAKMPRDLMVGWVFIKEPHDG